MLSVLALLAAGGGLYLASQRNWGDSTAQQRAASISQDDLKQALEPLQQSIKDLQVANQHAADQISDFQRQLSGQQGEQKLPLQQSIKDLQAAIQRATDQLSAQQGEQKLLNQQVAALSARLDRMTNAEAATPGRTAKGNIANAKKKTSTHPATTAGQDGTTAAPAGTALGAQPGATAPGMAGGAPEDIMSQPGATAPAGMAGAPVGHRQPRAQDLPPQQRNPNDPMAKEDEALDKKIKSICRGC